jgi:3D (Asp-Asp-Asp) domain-containing protein
MTPGLCVALLGLALTGLFASPGNGRGASSTRGTVVLPTGGGLVPITAAEVARERGRLRDELNLAHHVLATAERRLAARLHALYVDGHPEPLEVLLGSRSLDEALTDLDRLERAAAHDRVIAARARAARQTALRISRMLALREAELHALGRARGLAGTETSEIVRPSATGGMRPRAGRSEARDALPRAWRATRGAAPVEFRVLTVVAYGYAIKGSTASGSPAGPGTVAVDPSVLPFGTRLQIPGYGAGIAADTGSSIRGATIDLWFPTEAQARAWGRRTVTILVDAG